MDCGGAFFFCAEKRDAAGIPKRSRSGAGEGAFCLRGGSTPFPKETREKGREGLERKGDIGDGGCQSAIPARHSGKMGDCKKGVK